MIDLLLFFVIGVIIFIGFFSLRFFEHTGIPDVVILMIVGFILGTTLSQDTEVFNEVAPIVGAIALMMIMLEGGMHLNISRVLNELYNVVGFTITTFAFSTVTIMNVLHYFFQWPMNHGLLLGSVLGGSSSAIVILLISRMKTSQNTKTILSLESALTDALCIVATLSIVQLMTVETASIQDAIGSFIGVFSTAIVLGGLSAIIWIRILEEFYGKSFAYLMTIAVVLMTYSSVEFLGGNGAIAILVFGIVLGNYSSVAKSIHMESDFSLESLIKKFHTEISFFVRTFFFVYLGLIFDYKSVNTQTVLIAFAVLISLLIVRLIAVRLLVIKEKTLKDHMTLLVAMMPRGLAAAVLASVPLTAGLMIPNFREIVVLTIFSTSIVATIGSYIHSRHAKSEEEEVGKKENSKK